MGAWLAAGSVAAISIAWIAAKLHAAFAAPVGSVSIAIGLFLGLALGALAVVTKAPRRRTLIIAAVLLSLLVVFAQHAWLYAQFRRQWREARARSPEIAMFRGEQPWSPVEYFNRELMAGRAAVWCLDGALIVGTAVGIFAIMERKRSEFGLAADAKGPDHSTLNPEP
jgi:hypothetical protein